MVLSIVAMGEEMLSTILLCWYSLSWVIVGIMAIEDEELKLAGFLLCFIFTPLLIFYPFIWISENAEKVIWKKKMIDLEKRA